jgi:hypothetical protein
MLNITVTVRNVIQDQQGDCEINIDETAPLGMLLADIMQSFQWPIQDPYGEMTNYGLSLARQPEKVFASDQPVHAAHLLNGDTLLIEPRLDFQHGTLGSTTSGAPVPRRIGIKVEMVPINPD